MKNIKKTVLIAFSILNVITLKAQYLGGSGGGFGVASVGSGTAVALPVQWLHFDATCNEGSVQLNWSTASELNNDYFTIERSADGANWQPIGNVNAAGNSSEVVSYWFTDREPSHSKSYYRIKQTDFDGASEYSDVRKVIFETDNLDGQNMAIYPNPFTSDVYIDCSTLSGGKVTIVVSNVAGQQLIERSISNTGQIEKVDLSSLPKGMYFVHVTMDTGTTTVKVIKR